MAKTKLYECKVCGFTSTTKQRMQVHFELQHMQIVDELTGEVAK